MTNADETQAQAHRDDVCADDHAAWREDLENLQADVEMWRRLVALKRPGTDVAVTYEVWRSHSRGTDVLVQNELPSAVDAKRLVEACYRDLPPNDRIGFYAAEVTTLRTRL